MLLDNKINNRRYIINTQNRDHMMSDHIFLMSLVHSRLVGNKLAHQKDKYTI